MKIAAALLAVSLIAAGTARGQGCNAQSHADRVRVTLIDCGDLKQVFVRHDGNDREPVALRPTATPAVWETAGFDGSIESNVLCSKFCPWASECATPTPKVDKEGGKNICVATYQFRCDEDGWTLLVQSAPAVINVDWTRKRAIQGSIEQRGELKAAPGKLCDLASDETINLRPKLSSSTPFTFKDIPIKRSELEQQKEQKMTYGPTDLVRYINPPPGRRTQPLSDVEKSYLAQQLRELTVKIDGLKATAAGGQ